VQNLCESQNAIHRESGAFILFTILEVVIEGLQDKVADFLNLFRHLLADPESIEVRLVTIRALGTLAGYIDIEDKAEIVRDFTCSSIVTHRAVESVPRSYSSDSYCHW
jgi:importin-4